MTPEIEHYANCVGGSACKCAEIARIEDEPRPEYDPNAWGNHPYDNRSVADVIYDYAVIRGDLTEQYARDQFANWIERLVRQRQAESLRDAADAARFGVAGPEWAEPVAMWLEDRAARVSTTPDTPAGADPCARPGCGHARSRHGNLGCLVERGNSGSGSVADAVFCRCIAYLTTPDRSES